MRIGMILDKTFPPDPRVENEAIALIKSGHQVFLFCLKYGDEIEIEIIHEIQVRRYLSNKLEYKLSALAYTLPFYTNIMAKKINHFLLNNKIDVIHMHDMVIAGSVLKANKNLKLPTVLDLHENRPEIMKLYPHLQKFPGKQLISPKKWKVKEEQFISEFDKIIVVTEEAKKDIVSRIKMDSNNICIVPNSVNRSFYTDIIFDDAIINKYKNKFVILYLGDTGLRRGLQTAIQSVEKLKIKIENLKLVIVGRNTTDHILMDQVKALGIKKYVDFEGWQDVSLFPSYIYASDIGISPLDKNKHHDTTYANKIFQYMSFAKPVLVSDATAQKQLVLKTKSGLVHQEKDVSDFTKKILELYNDQDLRKELGENGKKFIEEEFVWEKVSQNLVDIYDNFEAGK